MLGITYGALFDLFQYSMLTANGAAHRRRRSPFSRSFAARMITDLRPHVRRSSEELIDEWYSDGQVEFVEQFAAQLPARVIIGQVYIDSHRAARLTFRVHAASLSETERVTKLFERTLEQLDHQLRCRVSRPGDTGYVAATAIWAAPTGPMPRAVVHCENKEDVQWAIRAARELDLPLSVRGGGHDWAGRSLCSGIVIDLSGMNGVVVDVGDRMAWISGGALASDLLSATDSLGFAAVTGSCGGVGMAGLTIGGGYGPLIGRFGLAIDNLIEAEVVLADGRVVAAGAGSEDELFWALRGGGGGFGVVTLMRYRLHDLPSIRAGSLLFPFAEARAVLEGCAEIVASASDELTFQVGLVIGPDGAPVVTIMPVWCGSPEHGETAVAPFFKLGTPLAGAVEAMPSGGHIALTDPFVVHGQRVLMETCWLPSLGGSIDAFLQASATAVSSGCKVITHEFRGAASRVPADATAFGLRRDHVLVEIIASCASDADLSVVQRHRQWSETTLRGFDDTALPGGYPNLLGVDPERAAKSYGDNAARLVRAKRQYDPDNVFRAAIPLPDGRQPGAE
jgi:FAD/FMN-containing dehydrogenase